MTSVRFSMMPFRIGWPDTDNLAVKECTYLEDATKLAQGMEAANRNVKDLQGGANAHIPEVHNAEEMFSVW